MHAPELVRLAKDSNRAGGAGPHMYSLWARANKGNADLLASPRKIGIFRQEAIARMDAVCPMLPVPQQAPYLSGPQSLTPPDGFVTSPVHAYKASPESLPPLWAHIPTHRTLKSNRGALLFVCKRDSGVNHPSKQVQTNELGGIARRRAHFARAKMPS